MPARKPQQALTRSRNADRPNGKARKGNPGVSEHAYTGRTVGGFSPAALERRAERRTVAAAAKAASAAASSAPSGPTESTGPSGPRNGGAPRANRKGHR